MATTKTRAPGHKTARRDAVPSTTISFRLPNSYTDVLDATVDEMNDREPAMRYSRSDLARKAVIELLSQRAAGRR